jgi:hypothetical protein
MLWTFAGGGKLFMYQNTALILGYSYGFFTAKDLLKVGAVLTVTRRRQHERTAMLTTRC